MSYSEVPLVLLLPEPRMVLLKSPNHQVKWQNVYFKVFILPFAPTECVILPRACRLGGNALHSVETLLAWSQTSRQLSPECLGLRVL